MVRVRNEWEALHGVPELTVTHRETGKRGRVVLRRWRGARVSVAFDRRDGREAVAAGPTRLVAAVLWFSGYRVVL